VASSVLAPIAGGAPVAIAAYFLADVYDDAETLFLLVVIGFPFAIILCLLGTSILQHKDLFEMRYSQFYCGLIGALIASVAAMSFFELGLVFGGIVLWGFLSGISFRKFLSYRAT
jgi:hypothetical protein